MKRIKILIAAILVFSLSFSLTACGKPTDEEQSTFAESVNATTEQLQNETISNNTIETIIISQPESTTFTVLSTTTQQEQSQTQNNSKPSSNPVESEAQKPTQEQQTTAVQTSAAPETNTPNTESGVNSYSADYKGITHTVFYPADAENKNVKYPVIIFANGTGFSYTIYENLLKEMAKGGYIVVANNVTMAGDGTAQISSLDFIIAENTNSASVLYKNVVTDRAAAAGHSQGGRSAVNAAAADSRFDCVISLAGSNYTEEAEKLKTPTLFLSGTKDMIVDADRWVKSAYDVCNGPAVYASLINGIHTSCCTNPTTYTNYVLRWCDYWLKNDTSAKSVFTAGGELSNDTAWSEFSCKDM